MMMMMKFVYFSEDHRPKVEYHYYHLALNRLAHRFISLFLVKPSYLYYIKTKFFPVMSSVTNMNIMTNKKTLIINRKKHNKTDTYVLFVLFISISILLIIIIIDMPYDYPPNYLLNLS